MHLHFIDILEVLAEEIFSFFLCSQRFKHIYKQNKKHSTDYNLSRIRFTIPTAIVLPDDLKKTLPSARHAVNSSTHTSLSSFT
jgi:hypothetical protein